MEKRQDLSNWQQTACVVREMGLPLKMADCDFYQARYFVHFVTICLLAAWCVGASAQALSPSAIAALAKLLPPGYRTDAVFKSRLEGGDNGHFIAALVDTDSEQPRKSVRLLHLSWNGRWTILDSIELSGTASEPAPQYLNGISMVKVGQGNLLYVYSNWSGGGSGSVHYYQFFTAHSGHLKLVRTFEHERMERGYLCLRNERIHDARAICDRGEKKAEAYAYACHLETTEFTYDKGRIVAIGGKRLAERKGNRFLGETYWNMSLCSVLGHGSR
jgi:hypothetical protein